eukprot:tig00021073_g18037.t1
MHHADSQSWRALAALADALLALAPPERRIAVVATSRPIAPGAPIGRAAAALLRGAGACERAALGAMSDADAEALICSSIGAARVPRVLRDFICTQTDSLPFLVVDLARSLVEDGSIQVDGAGSVLLKKALRRLKPSDGARASLVSRLDKLSASQAMTLKLASVVGVSFTNLELLAIHPQPAAVPRELAALAKLNIVVEAAPDEGEAGYEPALERQRPRRREFRFKQPLMQEVVYSLLPVTDRRALHLKLATYHEGLLAERGDGQAARAEAASVLAHHFALAEQPERARPHLEACAAAAYAAHANLEAARLYEDLLKLSPKAPALKKARWLRLRADLYQRMEMHHEAVALCQGGLDALGRSVPRSGLLQRVAARWHLFRLRFSHKRPPADDAAGLEEEDDDEAELEPGRAREREAMGLLVTLISSAFHTSRMTLRLYGIARLALLAARRPTASAVSALGVARVAQCFAAAGRPPAALRWAALARSIAHGVDRTGVAEGLMNPLADVLIRCRRFEEAGESLAAWALLSARQRNKNGAVDAAVWRVALAFRSSARHAAPAGAGALVEELRAVLEGAGRNPDLLDEAHLSLGETCVAVLRLFQDEAPAALAALEAYLAARFRGAVRLASPYLAAVGATHAEALYRVYGPAGRAWDGRPVARVALDAIAVLKRMTALGAAVVSDFAFSCAYVLYLHLLRAALTGPRGVPNPLLLPASTLYPAATPANPPPPRAKPASPSGPAAQLEAAAEQRRRNSKPGPAGAAEARRNSKPLSSAQATPSSSSDGLLGRPSSEEDEGDEPTPAEMRAGILAACRLLERGLAGAPPTPRSAPAPRGWPGRRAGTPTTWRRRCCCRRRTRRTAPSARSSRTGRRWRRRRRGTRTSRGSFGKRASISGPGPEGDGDAALGGGGGRKGSFAARKGSFGARDGALRKGSFAADGAARKGSFAAQDGALRNASFAGDGAARKGSFAARDGGAARKGSFGARDGGAAGKGSFARAGGSGSASFSKASKVAPG